MKILQLDEGYFDTAKERIEKSMMDAVYGLLPQLRCEDGRGGGMRIPKPRRLVPWAPQRKIFFSIFAKNKAR